MRLRTKNNKSNNKNNAGFILCIVLLILVAVFCTITAIVRHWEDKVATGYEEGDGATDAYARMEVDGIEYVRNPMIETILFLGLDTYDELGVLTGYKHVLQSDFVGLMVIDKETNTYQILQINRDTMMEMSILSAFGDRIYDGTGDLYTVYQQFTLAYNYGDGYTVSADNTSYNLSLLLNNAPVDHYVVFSMSSIPILNDLVGGIEVTIEDDLTEVDETLVQGEMITLNGDQAIAYVQSRQTVADGTNINRMERQQEYLSKLYEKIMENESNNFFTTAMDSVSEYMFTDTSANTLARIITDIEECENLGFVEIEGTANYEGELAEFYLDEEAKIQVILDLFYEEAK